MTSCVTNSDVEVGEAALAVEMHHGHFSYGEPARLHDVDLESDVGHVFRAALVGLLHLDGSPSTPIAQALEHVDDCHGVITEEGGFEEHCRPGVDECPRLRCGTLQVEGGDSTVTDQVAIGPPLPRELTAPAPLLEQHRGDLRADQLHSLRLVGLQPEALRTSDSAREPALAQAASVVGPVVRRDGLSKLCHS